MSVLRLQGTTYTLHLQGEQQENIASLSVGLGCGTGHYRYRGQGVIVGGVRKEHFLFTTFSTEESRRFSVLVPVPFDSLNGFPRDRVLQLLERDSSSVVDALCEETFGKIHVWNRQHGSLFLPELHFELLSRDFIARYLLGKTPLVF